MEALVATVVAYRPNDVQIFSAIVVAVLVYVIFTYKMQPKQFYLIRHGRTLLNEAHIKQGAEGKLSPAGEAQAHSVGAYLHTLHIQRIYASPYERAQQTATIIGALLPTRVRTTPLLRERKNPTEVIGKSTLDPNVLDASDLIDKGFHEDDFRFSDEENFADLKKRARECLSFFERLPAERVCVVTHHAFLKMLLAYMTYREDLHVSDYIKLSFFNPAENGGVTVCVYHPYRALRGRPDAWEIVSFNEVIPEEYTAPVQAPERDAPFQTLILGKPL